MPGDSTTSPPPGPVEEFDFSDLDEDPEDEKEEVTATGIATAAAAAAAMAMSATTAEERPTLVPEIDLQALAKLGPEAFAHRQAPPPADLLASMNASTTPTQTQLQAQMPAEAKSVLPSPLPTPIAPAVAARSVVPPSPPFDMFELDTVDVAFEEEKRRSLAPGAVSPFAGAEEDRPTSRPPQGEGPDSVPGAVPAGAARAQTVDDFFNDLDDPSDMHPMTEPPGEAGPTDIPPNHSPVHFDEHAHENGAGKTVDELFADMIDEPFPPSFVPAALAAAMDPAPPDPALALPLDAGDADEVFDADADEAMADLRARFEAGDFPGALHLAETLANDMLHAAEVAEITAGCQAAMQARYVERIGSLTKVPVISVPMSVILDLPIDNRAGFLLSRIDGVSSLEMILDMCGMSELDALRIVYDLVQNGALEFI